MNKKLLDQGYLGPVKSTAMIYKIIFGLLNDHEAFDGMKPSERNKAITKVCNTELRKLRNSDTLVEKVVTGESRGRKHYYKKEPFEAYLIEMKGRLMHEYGITPF